jgi:hypothetical protein
LQPGHRAGFLFRQHFCDNHVQSELPRYRLRRVPVVSRQHNRLDAHFMQGGDRFPHSPARSAAVEKEVRSFHRS